MESYNLYMIFLSSLYYCSGTYNYSEINLYPDHLPYFFNMYKDLADECVKSNCPLKMDDEERDRNINDWLLLPSSDISDYEEDEDEVEDELLFDRVFQREIEIQLEQETIEIPEVQLLKEQMSAADIFEESVVNVEQTIENVEEIGENEEQIGENVEEIVENEEQIGENVEEIGAYMEATEQNEEDMGIEEEYVGRPGCWGYEGVCPQNDSYSTPSCPGDHKGWVPSKKDQIKTFYTQGDFGYIAEQQKELMVICEPTFPIDSSLMCSKHLRYCQGRNIRVDFRDLVDRKEPIRYKMDVLKEGQIGGYCKLHKERLEEECDHISPLQSWGPELRFFTELPHRPIQTEGDCDVVIDRPTYFMKIDATVNMYHHFCDFFNLYASQHVKLHDWTTFSTDVHVLIWESFTYMSNFAPVWKVFTRHPIWDLKSFTGKTVCFRNLIFPLLPRMIFGLYYNTPLIWGCEGSGLFHAFSRHVLHRLAVPRHPRTSPVVRVTLLSRESAYRNILNEAELLSALQANSDYQVQRVVYSRHLDFNRQLELTHNSDIFIGIHGAGLTHLLFLPDWAVVFELYNCEDESCYLDLARLRGIKYITWEDKEKLWQEDEGHHPDGGAHAKFTNYKFDVEEFLRLVAIGAEHVRNHKSFPAQISHDEL